MSSKPLTIHKAIIFQNEKILIVQEVWEEKYDFISCIVNADNAEEKLENTIKKETKLKTTEKTFIFEEEYQREASDQTRDINIKFFLCKPKDIKIQLSQDYGEYQRITQPDIQRFSYNRGIREALEYFFENK